MNYMNYATTRAIILELTWAEGMCSDRPVLYTFEHKQQLNPSKRSTY